MRVTKLQHEKNESQTKNNTPKHGKRTTKSETASERQRTQGKWTKTNGQEDENKKRKTKKKRSYHTSKTRFWGVTYRTPIASTEPTSPTGLVRQDEHS